jgi:hypothetical protein
MGKITVTEKLMNNVNKNPDIGCWEWTASKNKGGYGRIRARTLCV